ncbi:aspartate--tRNA(Asn) ligase [Patescibacteria group bacterium]|nr:aspartate--tRNA(Asn) ligase [Patescibacteria group bacterium]
MRRIFNIETVKYIGKEVKICGWVQKRRDHGGIVFLDLRDKSGILQVVCSPKLVKDVKDEYVLAVEGKVKKRPIKMINPKLETGKIEVSASKIEILAEAAPTPFDLKDQELTVSLPTLLDYRPLTLRHPKIKAIFKIREEIIESFRKNMKALGFFEFQAPTIVPVATEGGAEVFHIDYFNYDAYLAQSPQLYKQILVGVLERVFTVTGVYRAEPSITTRHLCEYTSLDIEMGFIDSWEELMDACQVLIYNIFSDLKKNCKKEFEIFGQNIPKLNPKIPRLKLREAQKIIFKRTKRDNRKEPDLEPEDEREICRWAKEKKNSELVFITHFPVEKRPFYTYPDPKNPKYTLSFDLLYRGLEIVTGGQRIHQYKKLLKNIRKFGLKIKDFKYYLQAFKYGMPPEGGFALGVERITKQVLGLRNVREASFFPRDMGRIDQKLSTLQPRRKKKKKK